MNLVRRILEQRKNNNINLNTEMCSFFYVLVVEEEIPNYLMLEVLKKDKQYQEQIEKILEQSKKENDNNKKGE